jgi:hypothetical protein
MATLSAKRSVRTNHRRLWANIGQIALTAVVIGGSVTLANLATRWLLAGITPASFHAVTSASVTSTKPTVTPPPGTNPIAVGLGATQSINGLAITMTNLRLVTTQGFVGAPAGEAFAIVTVTLVNTDPTQASAYNGGDFVFVDSTGQTHPEVFAALAAPLGVGTLAPQATTQGDLAFLIPYPVAANAPDPQIRYQAARVGGFMLNWSLPLGPLLP